MNKFIAHILVVDDDDGIRSLVKKYLNENNFLVTTSESAENASEKIKIIKFDLIILDIMMPGKSGLEFIKENNQLVIRGHLKEEHITVTMVTNILVCIEMVNVMDLEKLTIYPMEK